MFNECINGHVDEIFDGYCDNCGADLVLDDMAYPGTLTGIDSFISLIKSFIEKLTEFFRNLFN